MSHRLNIYHIYGTTTCAYPEDYYCRCCAHFLLIFSYFFHFTKLRLLFTACNSQPQKRIQVQTFKFNIKYVQRMKSFFFSKTKLIRVMYFNPKRHQMSMYLLVVHKVHLLAAFAFKSQNFGKVVGPTNGIFSVFEYSLSSLQQL